MSDGEEQLERLLHNLRTIAARYADPPITQGPVWFALGVAALLTTERPEIWGRVAAQFVLEADAVSLDEGDDELGKHKEAMLHDLLETELTE